MSNTEQQRPIGSAPEQSSDFAAWVGQRVVSRSRLIGTIVKLPIPGARVHYGDGSRRDGTDWAVEWDQVQEHHPGAERIIWCYPPRIVRGFKIVN